MIYRYPLFTVFFLFFLLAAIPCIGQQSSTADASYEEQRARLLERQNDTRSQIRHLEEQIRVYNERLGTTTERYDELYRQYEELSRVITLQQERLRQMNAEQQQIREEIDLIESNQAKLEDSLRQLIREYQSTLTHLYKHGRTTELALVLTSASFNQLLVRSFYLARFDRYRQGQIDDIQSTQQNLEQAKTDLAETEERNRRSLASIREETRALEERQELQSKNIETLRLDRRNLENQIENGRQELGELNNLLDNLVEELRLAANRSEGASAPVIAENGVGEEELLAFENSFRSQKGQLPWPVENGTVTQRFGLRVHPVFNTQTNSPGIDIAAPARSGVHVVNDGYVYGVESLQGFGEIILVHHGEFLTAYGNVSEIYVRRNQVLEKGDLIGLSGDENSIRGEVLFFLIREGSQNVDPEEWLQNAVP